MHLGQLLGGKEDKIHHCAQVVLKENIQKAHNVASEDQILATYDKDDQFSEINNPNLPYWAVACSQAEDIGYLEEDDPDYAPGYTPGKLIEEDEEMSYVELEENEVAFLLKEAKEPLPEDLLAMEELPEGKIPLPDPGQFHPPGISQERSGNEPLSEVVLKEKSEEEKSKKVLEEFAPDEENRTTYDNLGKCKGIVRKRKRKKLTSVIDELSTKASLEPFEKGDEKIEELIPNTLMDSSEVLKIIQKYSDVALVGKDDKYDERKMKPAENQLLSSGSGKRDFKLAQNNKFERASLVDGEQLETDKYEEADQLENQTEYQKDQHAICILTNKCFKKEQDQQCQLETYPEESTLTRLSSETVGHETLAQEVEGKHISEEFASSHRNGDYEFSSNPILQYFEDETFPKQEEEENLR